MSFELAPHKWTNYEKLFEVQLEAPEFVLDSVIAAGTVVLAGERGLGKTTLLVPMMAAVAGLSPHYPLKASIRRHVVYVAEDTEQVRRILMAMRVNGDLIEDDLEVEKRFKLVSAIRLGAPEITRLKPHLEDFWDNNERLDGGNYCAPPTLVMDTTNATLDLENISDNSEVSKAVSTLREGLKPINVILIGHIAKHLRSDIKSLSFVGAGAWEGDTQQNLYLVSDGDNRYLVLGKKRFETDTKEFLLHSRCAEMECVDKLGQIVNQKCFYSWPEPVSENLKAERKAEKVLEDAARAFTALQQQVLTVVAAKSGAKAGEIKASVPKKNESVVAALEALVDSGLLLVKKEGNAKKYFLATAPEGDFTL